MLCLLSFVLIFLNGARYYDCAELELVYSNIESVVSKILGCVGLRILTSVVFLSRQIIINWNF